MLGITVEIIKPLLGAKIVSLQSIAILYIQSVLPSEIEKGHRYTG
jgi:hypothetical protein